MKIVPILTALLVSAVLFLAIIERDRLIAFATTTSPFATAEQDEADPDADVAETDVESAAPEEPLPEGVAVVVYRSTSQTIDSAVVLRGRTEAVRQVNVAAETSGLVVSDPLRKGAYVNAGDQLCQLDPGIREANLAEARARLAEAQGRVPEANAAIAEAMARLQQFARRLLERDTVKSINIVGHTDSSGTDALNRELSLARTIAVRDALIDSGVDDTVMLVSGVGSYQPNATNDTAEGRALNRRVEVRVTHTRK